MPPVRIRPRRLLKPLSRLPGLSFLREAFSGWDLMENSAGAWRAVHALSSPLPFDVIEVADWGGLGFWGTANPFRRVPILIRSHGYANTSLPGWDWDGIRFQLALERFAIRHADFVLTASRERVAHYRSIFGIDAARIAALAYGIDTARFCGDQAGPRRVDSDDVSILYLGRVERRKGCDVLFDALRMVHERCPPARATFVGPVAADMKDELAAFLREAQGWVEHVGPVPQDQARAYLGRSDLIVLPSRFETLPRVLIEALAAGVPQVASAANGISEIVEHGLTGLIVDPVTPAALAEGILRLCSSAGLRALMSQRSRERAIARFGINSVMETQVRVYRALAEGESPLKSLAV